MKLSTKLILLGLILVNGCKKDGHLPSFTYVAPTIPYGFHKLKVNHLDYLDSYSVCYRPGVSDPFIAAGGCSSLITFHDDTLYVDVRTSVSFTHNFLYTVNLSGTHNGNTVTVTAGQKVAFSPLPPPPFEWSASVYSGKPGDNFSVNGLDCSWSGLINDYPYIKIGDTKAGGCSACCAVPDLPAGTYPFTIGNLYYYDSSPYFYYGVPKTFTVN